MGGIEWLKRTNNVNRGQRPEVLLCAARGTTECITLKITARAASLANVTTFSNSTKNRGEKSWDCKGKRLVHKHCCWDGGNEHGAPAVALTVCWRGGVWQRAGRCWSNFWSQASWSDAAGSCCNPLWGPGPRGLLWAAALLCVLTTSHAWPCHEDAGHSSGSLLRNTEKSTSVWDGFFLLCTDRYILINKCVIFFWLHNERF